MNISSQKFELTTINHIENTFRVLGDSEYYENPIEAVFKGFESAKKIVNFINEHQGNEVFGKISEADIAVKEFQVLYTSLEKVLLLKSLGLVDFSKENFDEVIREKLDSKTFVDASNFLKNEQLSATVLLDPIAVFQKINLVLNGMIQTVKDTYKKDIDSLSDIEVDLLLNGSKSLKISNFEMNSMNVYSSNIGNLNDVSSIKIQSCGNSYKIEDSDLIYRPKNIDVDDWKNNVLKPISQAKELSILVTNAKEKMIKRIDKDLIQKIGLGFKKNPKEKPDLKNLGWLRNARMYSSDTVNSNNKEN